MIVNDGKKVLLDFQSSGLSTCYWRLGTNDVVVSPTTVLTDITEAAWSGYAQQAMNSMNAATLVGSRAQATPAANPTFSNTSGSDQTFYMVYLMDPVSGKLVDARNIGATTIPDGQDYVLLPAITDTQE